MHRYTFLGSGWGKVEVVSVGYASVVFSYFYAKLFLAWFHKLVSDRTKIQACLTQDANDLILLLYELSYIWITEIHFCTYVYINTFMYSFFLKRVVKFYKIQTWRTLDQSLDRYSFIYTAERKRNTDQYNVSNFPKVHGYKKAKQEYIEHRDHESRSCAGDQ